MKSKDLIRINLDNSMGFVLRLAEDMKDKSLTFPTPKGGNHPLWVMGHLVYSEGALLQEMMLGESNPLAEWKDIFSNGTEPVADADKYPPFGEVIAKCKEIHQANIDLLESLSEEDLDVPSKSCPPDYQQLFGTRRLCFQQVANHWWMHCGQIADARRAAGRKPLEA